MTRIDFYILPIQQTQGRLDFAARLCEKALRQQLRILVMVNQESLLQLDEALWSFRADAFVPHSSLGAQSPRDSVVLSCGEDDGSHHDLLINLTAVVSPIFSRFTRLAEIVIQEPSILQYTRAHYSFYKERGYPINTHKIAQ